MTGEHQSNDPINNTDPSGFLIKDDPSTSWLYATPGGIAAGIGAGAGIAGLAGGFDLGGLVTGLFNIAIGVPSLQGLGSQGGRFSGPTGAKAATNTPATTAATQATDLNKGIKAPVQEGGFGPSAAPGTAPSPSPQAPFVKDGRITSAGRGILRRTFDRYNFNVGQIRVIFKHNLGQSGITLGNRVYLDDSFQYRTPYQQMSLLAHEITHSVQYRDLGTGNFLERYAVGYGRPDNYDVPSELWALPKEKLSVTQSGSYLGQDGFRHDFTLDQIAERIGIETASAVPYP